MKIFISSLISGFEPFREAAKSAVVTLRHEPVMAEDFGAQPSSPQVACLQGVRSSDLVILVLGARYGYPQGSSGVSPTHEEYLEARDTKPMLVFVQDGVEREPEQAKFLTEVQAWQSGRFRDAFKTPERLRELVIRAIHDYQLSHAAGPLDAPGLVQTAAGLLQQPSRQGNNSGPPMLSVAFVGGPFQRVLRPAQLEEVSLAKALNQQALFGEPSVFDGAKGVDTGIDGAALVLAQDRGSRVQLDEHGSLAMRLPLKRAELRGRSGFGGLAIIEEIVVRQLMAAIAYSDWVLERIDPTQRLTQVAIAASIEAADFLGWRTQAEDDASPDSGQMRMGRGEDLAPVCVDRRRAALRYEAKALAEDLMVPLRRQRKIRNG